MRALNYQRHKGAAQIPISISVELSAIQNLFQLGQRLNTRAEIKVFQRFR